MKLNFFTTNKNVILWQPSKFVVINIPKGIRMQQILWLLTIQMCVFSSTRSCVEIAQLQLIEIRTTLGVDVFTTYCYRCFAFSSNKLTTSFSIFWAVFYFALMCRVRRAIYEATMCARLLLSSNKWRQIALTRGWPYLFLFKWSKSTKLENKQAYEKVLNFAFYLQQQKGSQLIFFSFLQFLAQLNIF